MTYDELFQLKGLEKAKLLAGKSILSREILGAHVVEIVEAQDWVRRGELVFVSGVAFRDVERDLEHSIHALAKKQVAGVVIEVGPYITEVTEDMIDLANHLNLPLLSLPYEIPVSEIISQIYFDIYSKEETNKSIEKFMADVLYGDTEAALERIELFKFDQTKKHVAIYAGIDTPEHVKAKEEDMDNLLKAVRMTFVKQGQLLYLKEDDGVVAIQELDRGDKLHKIMSLRREQIENSLNCNRDGSDMTVSMGVGNAFGGIAAIRDSVFESKKAYKVLRSGNASGGLRYYDEIGIYRVFFDLKSDEVLRNLLEETLGVLMQYDSDNESEMLHTLEVYLDQNCNIALTTDRLFVHRNTVKYRIKRIEDILGRDLKDVTVQFNLRLAFKIMRYIGK